MITSIIPQAAAIYRIDMETIPEINTIFSATVILSPML